MTPIPKILIISLIAGLFTQGLKVLIKGIKRGKINWRDWDDYGGMPSAHAAFLISLSTACALQEGIASTAFAICIILSAILIRDALGLRMFLENHGKILIKLIQKQPEEGKIIKFRSMGTRIGHTYSEIIVGALIGLILTFLLYPLF